MKFDAIVIGAGVSGLAAARELSGAGRRVCVVEARPRTGGRIHTHHVSGLPLPVELGAEFIHGDAHATFSIVQAAALMACELPDDHWWSRDGQWEAVRNFWERMDKVRSRIGHLRRDVSFAEFLRTHRSIEPRLRELARNFVEGYHAAHADRISAQALSSADEEQDDPGGHKQFRILGGYDAVAEWLRAGIDPERSRILLGTVVKSVTWRGGDVAVDCIRLDGRREQTIRASKAIVTIPIGVWKAPHEQDGAIRFDPPLTAKRRAIEKLEVGHVVKIVFRFAERFWDDFNFVHSSDRFVPTIWSSSPVRSPMLTAWAGGHAADALLAEGDEATIDRALDSVAKTFGMRRREIEDRLAGSFTHNWQSDPFSRGAYSYAGVGGTSAHGALARPVERTLFFAGEATSGDQTGTVAGAIESGRRAARQCRDATLSP